MIQSRRSALRSRMISLLSVACIAVLMVLAAAISAGAQTPAPQSRIIKPIDETNLVTLRGNTHPLARAQYDQGAAPDSLPAERIQLLLQRSPEQESALRQLLDEQKSSSSPNYHQWLTPAQFGQQFGPSDADIATVTAWLQSHGFTVNRVSAGRTVIEVSGNAGQVREAFHTEIHKYVVNGESHWANNADPQIPEALQPVVAGFVSLNNFPKKPEYQLTGRILPQTTVGAGPGTTPAPQQCASMSGGGSPYQCYAVAPYDFATIYNVLPLWSATPTAIDGTGQTVAIVGETDINCQDVINFRQFFGLPYVQDTCSAPTSNVQFFLNGPDPGFNGDEIEADLDVEWSGAVAKGAHIDFVTSESTETSQGIDLSAEYIVDNNLAPVMSESYGECEAFLLQGGNAFYNGLWEQGAAQGITVITSAGDSGSAGCDDENLQLYSIDGAFVSGLTSTPFNVSAGGTDFNDVGNQSAFWLSSNNSTTQQSVKPNIYIPEIPWDDSCAAISVTGCNGQPLDQQNFVTGGMNIVAGGGGESNCVLATENIQTGAVSCDHTSAAYPNGAYPKPTWQSGRAVTGLSITDEVRDVPDVSLYAAAGSFSNSFYPICQSDNNANDAPCTSLSNFRGVGGTSSSAPAFAGIMAMVNQYMSTTPPPTPLTSPVPRQGNANYELYALASAQVSANTSCNSNFNPITASGGTGCTFYDVQQRSNSVPCGEFEGQVPYDCSNQSATSTTAGVLEETNSSGAPNGTLAFPAGAGYDMATGLGSVNAYNLVHNWPNIVGNFKTSTTSLTLSCVNVSATCTNAAGASPLTFVHGSDIAVGVAVSSAGGTPTGNAALIGTPNPNSLTGGSKSPSAAADIFCCAGNLYNLDVYTLGSNGSVSGTTYYVAGGTYSVTAHYTGDGTFGASDSPPVPVVVSPESSTAALVAYYYNPTALSCENLGENCYVGLASGSTLAYGTAELFRLSVAGNTSGDQTATGNVTFTDNSSPLAQTGTTGSNEPFTLNSDGYAEFQTPTSGLFNNGTQIAAYVIPPLAVSAQPHVLQAAYLGAGTTYVSASTPADASYDQSQSGTISLTVTKAQTTISDGAAQISSGSSPCSNPTTSTFTVGNSVTIAALIGTESYGNIPTGTFMFVSSKGETIPSATTSPFYDPNFGFSEVCAYVTYAPTATETVTATYSGDANYTAPAAGAVTTITATTGSAFSFTSSPNSTSGTAAVITAPGASGQSILGISLAAGTNSVTLSASLFSEPSGATDPPTCSFSPNPDVTAGTSNVTMMCTTTAASRVPPPPAARPNLRLRPLGWIIGAVASLLALLLLLTLPERRRGYALLVLLLFVAVGAGVACGGGGGSGIAGGGGGAGGGGNPGTTPGPYQYTVSGTPAGGTTTVWFNVN